MEEPDDVEPVGWRHRRSNGEGRSSAGARRWKELRRNAFPSAVDAGPSPEPFRPGVIGVGESRPEVRTYLVERSKVPTRWAARVGRCGQPLQELRSATVVERIRRLQMSLVREVVQHSASIRPTHGRVDGEPVGEHVPTAGVVTIIRVQIISARTTKRNCANGTEVRKPRVLAQQHARQPTRSFAEHPRALWVEALESDDSRITIAAGLVGVAVRDADPKVAHDSNASRIDCGDDIVEPRVAIGDAVGVDVGRPNEQGAPRVEGAALGQREQLLVEAAPRGEVNHIGKATIVRRCTEPGRDDRDRLSCVDPEQLVDRAEHLGVRGQR